MKTNFKKVFLGLILALCLAFTLFGTSYLGAKVSAAEGEVPPTEETVPEVVIPEGTFKFEDENGVATLNFIDAKKLHMKIVTLEGEVLENDLEYVYNKEKNYYEVGTGTEAEQRFTIDLETHTFKDYVEDTNIKETAKEIGTEIEKFVLLIFSGLSALGLSGVTIGTFAKWILGKLRKNNTDLKEMMEILKEAKSMFEESMKNNEEAKKHMQTATEIMQAAVDLMKSIQEDATAKSEEIGKLASEILSENTEGGGEDVSI